MNTDEKQNASWCSASSVTPDVTEISDINGTFSVKISAVASGMRATHSLSSCKYGNIQRVN